MARRLRDAADDRADVPGLDSIRHNIFRWESGGAGVSERYRFLYCRAFGLTEHELFAAGQPGTSTDDPEETPVPYARPSQRGEKRKLREQMRAAGLDHRQAAAELARLYRYRPRAAWREAHGWSQQEAADRINAYKGDTGLDPAGPSAMTAPHLCEYETWPGYGSTPTGRKPTPYLIAVLASIYGCHARDLIDLADRQNLPPADLMLIDTYTRPGPLQRNPTAGPGTPPGPPHADTGSSPYMVLALPASSQRIVIDLTGPEQDADTEAAPRLSLVNE